MNFVGAIPITGVLGPSSPFMINFSGVNRQGGWGQRLVAGAAALIATAGTLVVGATSASGASADTTNTGDACRAVTTTVRNAGTPATISGWLCLPKGAATKSIQLLVHGATYNKDYWNPPVGNEMYSYARAATAAGHATLAIDRIGGGKSTRPLAATLTANGTAGYLHQVVGQLKAGKIGGVAIPRVILVGHSLGSVVSLLEAATYRDVSAVVLTGFSHAIPPTVLVKAFTTQLHLASLDPKFAKSLNSVGYLTTIPGKRNAFFSGTTPDVTPEMIAYDERTKDLVAATEVPDGVTLGVILAASKRINVPTLVINGEKDPVFCSKELLGRNCSGDAALLKSESPYFAKSACLRAKVLPGGAHLLNFTKQTKKYRDDIFTWISSLGPTFTCPAAAPRN